MRSRFSVLSIGMVVWLFDYASKQWALATLADGHSVHLVGDVLWLQLTWNPGAAFSLGTGSTWVFTVLASLVIIGILVGSARVTTGIWLVGLGGLLGGAAGNLTDRLSRPPSVGLGHVVDFIATPHFPVFNLADSAIVASVALMFIASIFGFPTSGRRQHG